jgi:hypothetical protein
MIVAGLQYAVIHARESRLEDSGSESVSRKEADSVFALPA